MRRCLKMLTVSSAGTGFIHDSFNKDYPAKFTRSWFAWVNRLFAEPIAAPALRNRALLDR